MASASCKKVLDVTPYTAFTDATVYTDAARVELAMVGVYDAAQSGFYPEGLAARGYPFGAANLQQDDLRGEDMINMESFYQITYNSTYVSTSPNCYNIWNNCYALINKANIVIEGVAAAIANGVITEAAGKAYQAECRFLRAMAMHQLLIEFARPYADQSGATLGVVIRDFAINSDASIAKAAAIGRSSVVNCYTFIEKDLAFAAENLPDTRSSYVNFRATKAAAIALQMRVFLHEGKWSDVLTAGAKIVSGSGGSYSSPIGGWKLTAAPDGPFADNTSAENIFSIENTSTDNGAVSGALQSMYGSNSTDIGARGLIGISPILWNLSYWQASDVRRNLTVANFSNGNPSTAPSGKKPMYFTYKYRETGWGDDAPQIRYAEVLLIMAEAYARQNNTVDATGLGYLNAVRNRAVTTAGLQYTTSSFAATQDFIKAVLAERRIEFLGEGKRWGDLHRLALDPLYNASRLAWNGTATSSGIPGKVLASAITATNFATLYSGSTPYSSIAKGLDSLPYDNYRFVWGIPATEVTNSNGVIKQNDLY
ncbi:outer membrane protein, nutrient binding [Filimonas lacunae]|nr:outer membrane protein, nutrient binding [Filimonas lacunae]